ncbi:hypothetical protein B0H16DRAFT_1578030 [Mycena metata]|uniref:Uncharacterized protein n=1 Tax=Mycena metata TaxID=1033252 RepID=A0AAD7MV21_9AGAR|nr:hypothetical protein B0H16DRAFT_1578030 [Mycena metata]
MSVATVGSDCYSPRASTNRVSRPAPRPASSRQVSATRVHSDKPPEVDTAHAVDVPQAPARPHTPSADVSLGVPELPVDVTSILQIIKHDTFAETGDRSKVIPGIELATWDVLKENHVEALDCRVEYWSEDKTLTVTYASGVHESFNFLFKPIARIADDIPDVFVETNHDILLPSSSSFTPDFALAVKGVPTKYHIIFECAWSQPDNKLTEKIKKYFMRTDISAVVSLRIRSTKQYESRKDPAPPDYQPLSSVEAYATSLLSDVIIAGHTWGPAITGISLAIHRRGREAQIFENLCPVEGQFTDDQIAMHYEINEILIKVLSQAVTTAALVKALRGEKFTLDWENFVQMLNVYHRSDAYERYLKWAQKPNLKRRMEGEENDEVQDEGTDAAEDLDPDIILHLLGPPPPKRSKV